jgi:hypothetical protein
MTARTIRCRKHGCVVPPDAHREAIIADGMRCEHPDGQAAFCLPHPFVCHISTCGRKSITRSIFRSGPNWNPAVVITMHAPQDSALLPTSNSVSGRPRSSIRVGTDLTRRAILPCECRRRTSGKCNISGVLISRKRILCVVEYRAFSGIANPPNCREPSFYCDNCAKCPETEPAASQAETKPSLTDQFLELAQLLLNDTSHLFGSAFSLKIRIVN